MSIEVHAIKPKDFDAKVEVSAAYVETENEILFLQRASSEKGRWGVPAGKVKEGESAESAMKRELLEETGISTHSHSRIAPLGQLFIRKPSGDYIYHLYGVYFSKKPAVTLSNEHQDSSWITHDKIETFPLMSGALEAFFHFKKVSRLRMTGKTSVNGYLILKKGNQILLHLRKNTNYFDGYYGLVSGLIENGESAQQGLAREAKEEAGISVNPQDLRLVHCIHRQTNRLNIDLFFECDSYEGKVKNIEPEKCEALEVFPIDNLPLNMVDYVADAIHYAARNQPYSEKGWS